MRYDSVGDAAFSGTGVYAGEWAACRTRCSAKAASWCVLRQFRLALTQHLQRRRSPQRQRLLARRVPAQLHPGAPRQTDKKHLSPQMIVDGLRSGNNWVDSGQLIDRLAFVACAVPARGAASWPRSAALRPPSRRSRSPPPSTTPTRTCATARRWARSSRSSPAPTSSWPSPCATRRARATRPTASPTRRCCRWASPSRSTSRCSTTST